VGCVRSVGWKKKRAAQTVELGKYRDLANFGDFAMPPGMRHISLLNRCPSGPLATVIEEIGNLAISDGLASSVRVFALRHFRRLRRTAKRVSKQQATNCR